ncbi:polymorphic toxin-type HINT domain-containing protein [Roseateles sp. BYS96W]
MTNTPFPTLSANLALGFAPGTRIHTREGLCPIEAVRAGDLVLTHPERNPPPRRRRERNEYLYRAVSRVGEAQSPTTVRIELINLADGITDTLMAAPGQPFWTQPHGWVAAGHLRPGHALVLSFFGNAMVQRVETLEQSSQTHWLEVEGFNTYYVEQLGAWVGDNLAAAPLLPPEEHPAGADRPIDFTKPQTLLRIANYYNDFLEPPAPAAASATGLTHRAEAEKLRSVIKARMGQELAYDRDSVAWLDDYIERARLHTPKENWPGAIQLIGSFLGECLVHALGGEWVSDGGSGCVQTRSGMTFTHNKVSKQYDGGRESGDTILGFFDAIAAMDNTYREPTPGQLRLLQFQREPVCCIFVRTSLDASRPWVQIADADARWVRLVPPPGQTHVTSISLTSIKSFYVTSHDGRLVHTEWIAKAEWPTLPPDILRQLKQRLPARTTLGLGDLESGKPFLDVRYGPRKRSGDLQHGYSTSVTNISRQRVKVLRFAGMRPDSGHWALANVTGDFYTPSNFKEWYGLPGEWLEPGESVCDTGNWGQPPVLWAYYGVTDTGQHFVAGKVLERPVGGPEGSSEAHFVTPGPEQLEMAALLQKLRTNFERRQQSMNMLSLARITGAKPDWMEPYDQLSEVFERQPLLLTEGHIVWAALVQANKLLFKPGPDNCPAQLVYSLDDYFDSHPSELQQVAQAYMSFKGVELEDPELRAFARLITDELSRSLSVVLPRVFSNREVRSSTFMVFRNHLPNGVLSFSRFPILVHPSTSAVLMVPFEFWPIGLIVMCKEGRL